MLLGHMSRTNSSLDRAKTLLNHWADATETYWQETAVDPLMGCYGSGYDHWGVQSNLNYAATMATLARWGDQDRSGHLRGRALAALRHAMATHKTGSRPGTDGKQWGNSWISMLGIERAMHGLSHLSDDFGQSDHDALKRLLVSEADSLLTPTRRGYEGVCAGKWNHDGMNNPESNIWAGCLLHRVSCLYPESQQAGQWREQATRFLINGVSLSSDAHDQTIIDGRSIAEWHVGANFFDNFALDHQGYLNVGYMVICLSNAAILHFDLKQMGQQPPVALYHHLADLWAVLRRFMFADGRLARIGGDTRVRYSYCQEYLLPSLLLAADALHDTDALELASKQIALMEAEASEKDGLFYGDRLEWLRVNNPHYYARLESDRACVLAMFLNYLPLVRAEEPSDGTFEESVAGTWEEAEHGAVMHRSPTRIASFAWRAHGLTQGLCLSPQDSSLAEWEHNLCPVVRFLGDDGSTVHRRLLTSTQQTIPGGFVTCGSVMEGVDVSLPEAARCTDQACTHIAFAALPDGHTCLCIQYVVAATDRTVYISHVQDLHCAVPNDIFNGNKRSLYSDTGHTEVKSPPARDEILTVHSSWLNVDDTLGIVTLHGGDQFIVDRSSQRREGGYRSLFVEEICLHQDRSVRRCEPGEVLVDAGFAVISGATAKETRNARGGSIKHDAAGIRAVWVVGMDGTRYEFWANFGEHAQVITIGEESVELSCGVATLHSVGAL